MVADPDPYDSLLAEYNAAMACERAEWKVLGDTEVGAAERLVAYARWRVAAERTKTLYLRMRDVRAARPRPSSWPHPK